MRILHPAKLSFKNEGEIKKFLNKTEWDYYHSTCPTRNAKETLTGSNERTLTVTQSHMKI